MRNLGLDLVRSIAIILVIITHGRYFFAPYLNLNILAGFGLLGVEIFFVLSGFLIGKIIIKDILVEKTVSSVLTFYIRRWFRTLPLYYLVLIGILCMNFITGHRHFSFLNFVFLQNYNEQSLNIFGVSWSLSIEEWFYLTLPPLLLIGVKLCKRKTSTFLFSFIGVFIGVEIIIRLAYTLILDPTWDFGVRKNIFIRLDSIMMGVALAGTKIHFSSFYNKVTTRSKVLLSVSFIGLILVAAYHEYLTITNTFNQSMFAKVFLFPIISLLCVLLVASLESNNFVNNTLKNRLIAKVITFVSVTSYCVYLIHTEVFGIFQHISDKFHNTLISASLLLLSLCVVFVLAHLSYKYFELPILRYRDRVVTKNVESKKTISIGNSH